MFKFLVHLLGPRKLYTIVYTLPNCTFYTSTQIEARSTYEANRIFDTTFDNRKRVKTFLSVA